MRLIRTIAVAGATAVLLLAGTAPAEAVRGGSETQFSKHPSMVTVINKHWLNGWHPVCGGVLITPKHVLTAARCIDRQVNASTDYRVILGDDDTTKTEPTEVTMEVYRAAFQNNTPGMGHPDVIADHELAVISLQNALDLTGAHRHLATVTLPETASTVPVGTHVDVVGWGATARTPGEDHADKLRSARLPVVPKQDCADMAGLDTVEDAYLCAGSESTMACPGDQGGPLVTGTGDTTRLVGIVGITPPCGTGRPSTFTDVGAYFTWIKRQAPTVNQPPTKNQF